MGYAGAVKSFALSRQPRVRFADGAIGLLAQELAARNWRRVAIVGGDSSFRRTEFAGPLLNSLAEQGFDVHIVDAVAGADRFEASPRVVDACKSELRAAGGAPDAVVAIGGGAIIDIGKALAVALCHEGSIGEYLEGVGTRRPSAARAPFVAVPTTAGTGSEATKNAVLSLPQPGGGGFKKSLRHDAYIPDIAIIDPRLHLSCPRQITAASGLDAITQLLEAYLSTSACAFTDALALDGLRAAGAGFLPAVERGQTDLHSRGAMAYAAYLSGVCLANAGLGVVHGLAGPAGSYRRIPHGVVCGLLLPHATTMLAGRLNRVPSGAQALAKIAGAAQALSARRVDSVDAGVALLNARLAEFARVAALPPLDSYGITEADLDGIVAASGNKNSPYEFSAAERRELLEMCR